MRINQQNDCLREKASMKFFRQIPLGNVWRSVWRIFMWTLLKLTRPQSSSRNAPLRRDRERRMRTSQLLKG